MRSPVPALALALALTACTRPQPAPRPAADATPAPPPGTEVPAEEIARVRSALLPRARHVGCGRNFVCALTPEGHAACWGSDEYGLRSPPEGVFESLAVGERHACALDAQGAVHCWGWNDYHQTDAPAGRFLAVRAAGWVTCGIREDLSVQCWGSADSGRTAVPPGAFQDVELAESRGCGLKLDGSIACWGMGQPVPGTGFVDLAVGSSAVACGRDAEGNLSCAGFAAQGAPGGHVRALDGAAQGGACAVTDAGEAVCFGYDRVSDPGSAPPGPMARVFAGRTRACGLRPDGTAVCWGREALPAPGGAFEEIAVCEHDQCGRRADGSVACWGDAYAGQTRAPAGEFTDVASGRTHSCALRADGSVACWGDVRATQAAPPPTSGTFRRLVAGGGRSCALEASGRMTCWGVPWHRPPAASLRFRDVALAPYVGCGVTNAGGVACFGDNAQSLGGVRELRELRDAAAVRVSDDGVFVRRASGEWRCFANVLTPTGGMPAPTWRAVACPAAGLVDVAAEQGRVCGLAADGTVTCWPWPGPAGGGLGGASPGERMEGGPFRAVAASPSHVCAVTTAGAVRCAGANGYGQSDPHGGRFRAVAPGEFHTCALADDGRLVCWGSYAGGVGL